MRVRGLGWCHAALHAFACAEQQTKQSAPCGAVPPPPCGKAAGSAHRRGRRCSRCRAASARTGSCGLGVQGCCWGVWQVESVRQGCHERERNEDGRYAQCAESAGKGGGPFVRGAIQPPLSSPPQLVCIPPTTPTRTRTCCHPSQPRRARARGLRRPGAAGGQQRGESRQTTGAAAAAARSAAAAPTRGGRGPGRPRT